MTLATWTDGVLARARALLAAGERTRAESELRMERYIEGVLELARTLPLDDSSRERAALARFRAEVLGSDRGAAFWSRLRGAVGERVAALDAPQRARLAGLEVEPPLFEPLDFTRAETSYTRVLAWLLSPARLVAADPNAGLGAAPLRALLDLLPRSVPLPPLSEAALRTVSAQAELDLGPAGRVDVCVFLPGVTLVIEAKVDAGEGQDQLARYREALDTGDGSYRAVFLSPPGRASETDPDALPLSFRELLRAWLPVAAAGDSGQHRYLRSYLKSVAGLYHLAGSGPFERWGVVTQLRVLQFLTSGPTE